jgi:hypothetical protein
MSKEKCGACPLVCELREKAAEVVAALPITEVESDFIQQQYDGAHEAVEQHELLQAEEDVVSDVIGLPGLTSYSPEDHIAAHDRMIEAGQLLGQNLDQNYMLLRGGAEWAGYATRMADELEASCDRGVRHGLRVPLIDVVIPTPEQIGNDYCGANRGLQDHADFQLRLGEIGITNQLGHEA